MKHQVVKMLRAKAEAQKSISLLQLELLMKHSGSDFESKKVEEALQMLIDADKKLETLNKYFSVELG